MYETSIVFGTVHSDGNVAVLLNTLVPDLILLALSRIVRSIKRANIRSWHTQQIVHLFQVGLLRLISLCRFFYLVCTR